MSIIVRRLANIEKGYCAYLKGMQGTVTYMVYFLDDIFGAISLHTFIEMVKHRFVKEIIDIRVEDTPVTIENKMVLGIITNEREDRV